MSCGSASRRWSAVCCRIRTSGVLVAGDLARLREVTASQGLMLESVNPDLVAHQGSPTQAPGARAWRRSAPPASCGSRSRAGSSSGSARPSEERFAALEALAAVHAEYGHLQEVILQNFVPHQSYYGREPARDRRCRGSRLLAHRARSARPALDAPAWACAGHARADARARRRMRGELLPGVGIQVPPNLSDWWPELVRAGATDLGGLSAPTAITSRPSTRSRRPRRLASACRATATR